MGKYRGLDKDEGWIKRRFAKIEKQMREDRAAKRLAASTIGSGGVTIKDGGSLNMETADGAHVVLMSPFDLGAGHGFQFSVVDETGAPVLVTTRYDPAALPPNGDTSVFLQGDRVVARSKSATSEFFIDDTQTYINAGATPLHFYTSSGVTIQHNTTGSAANAVLDAVTGLVSRSTSSLRYKQDVEDAEVDPAAVLDMQPRTWRDKAEVEKDPDTETRYVGFIAEELHELGLSQFVVYDADGDPEAISYDRLTVALLAVLKDQEKRIAALEAEDA